MGLESHSRSILRSELSKEYLKRITYLTSDSRIDFQTNLEESLKSIYGPESKFNFLVAEKEKLRKTIEQKKFPERIEEWELGINKLMDSKLSEIDLGQFEMSNKVNIDLFLSIIEKSDEFIDDAKLYLKRISKTKRSEWDDFIHQIGKKSKDNALFWDDFDLSFDYNTLDRSDYSNLKLIFALGKDFYKNLNTKLYLVQNKNLQLEDEHLVAQSLATVLLSFIRKEEDIRKTKVRIKKWYDDNVEDITYKLLLKRIMESDKTMFENESFELITKLSIVNDKITDHSFENQDSFNSKYNFKPEVDNLVLVTNNIEKLRIRLLECYNILNGNFIKESNPEIFICLFEKDRFIAPVEWIGSNKELNYFITQIADELKESRFFWQLVHNCFVRNGKKIGIDSVRSHGTPKPIADNSKIVLDKAINSLIN
jgi:hypothetical protein